MSDRVTILVIDDDETILHSLQDSLQLPGMDFRVITASSGLRGLQLAKQTLPELIILDLQMPDLDGFEVLIELRQDPHLSGTKVIMLTAQDSSKNLWQSIDERADDFIGKPFDLMELEARIIAQLV